MTEPRVQHTKNFDLEQDIVSSAGFRVLDGVKFAAKVAHGYATACLGLDGFVPYLPTVIRNEQDALAAWYVGITDDLAGPIEGLHRIRLEAKTQLSAQLPGLPKTIKKLVVVYLDLFSEYRLPTYEIVVGEISPE